MSGSLPAGFTLDQPASTSAPPSTGAGGLPAGFTLDAPASQSPADSASLGMQDVASAPAAPMLAATAAPPAQSGGWLDSAVREAAQLPTFGLADKFAAGMDALTQPLLGRGSQAGSVGQRYSDDLSTQRAQTAADPTSAKIVGNTLGLAGAVATDAPGAVLGAAGRIAEAVPGVNGLMRIVAPAGQVVENTLARLPGSGIVAPIIKSVAANAAIGGVAGGADADGGVHDHLQGAETGAIVGGALGGAGTVAMQAIKPIVTAGRAIYADIGKGAQTALTDASGSPISAPVTASQANKAGAIVRGFASDPQAVQASLDAHAAAPPAVPGFQPTTYQVTGDTGLGQLEQGTRGANQQQFIDRANQQNDALVGAVNDKAPAGSDSYAVAPAIQAQAEAIDTTGRTVTDAATADRDQAVAALPQTTEATPEQAGGTIRQQVETQRVPVVQAADAKVQTAQQGAQDATAAIGGASPAGGDQTALQDLGGQLRQTLSSADDAARAHVSGLYDQIDPNGTLAMNAGPIKQAVADVRGNLTASEVQPTGEEAAIHDVIQGYPDVQSLKEVQALESRIKTAQAAQRAPGGDPNVARRLGTVLDGVSDAKAQAIEDALGLQSAEPAAAATVDPQQTSLTTAHNNLADQVRDWYKTGNVQSTVQDVSGRSAQSLGGDAPTGPGRVPPAYFRQGQAGGGSSSLPGSQGLQPGLTPNFTAEDAAAMQAANAAHRERMDTFTRAPGVGDALAANPSGRGGYRIEDSQVPSRLFSGGPKAAERVQASVAAGVPPADLAKYAAFSLRRAAEQPDGSLDPAKYTSWMNSNREAFDALGASHPAIRTMFANADQASRTLGVARTERAAIDAAHPLRPGLSDADVAMSAVRPGPTGQSRVQAMLKNAGNTDQAKGAVSDVLAHLYDTKVIRNGEVDRGAHDRFVKAYQGALSATPDLADKFATVAKAQQTVDDAKAAHVQATETMQKSAARFFLGGGEPADRVGAALADPNRVENMRHLVALTSDDPAARDGLKRAVVEHINKTLLSQTTVSQGGERRIQPAGLVKFVRDKGSALEQLFSPNEMDGLHKVAEMVNTANQSVQNVKPQGGSDTVYKALAALKTGGSTPLMSAVKEHGAEAVGGLTGAKIGSLAGPVGTIMGATIGSIGGKVVQSMRAANIKTIDNLVTEAMLNPGLARVLMSRVTPENHENVGKAWASALKRLAVVQAAKTASGGT